ncbi:MAG TPA: hypothetical protein VKF40_16585 [Burkholderiales bacterium]|nr:hypothetical protein [Burkholderiales bacterium]
MPLARVFRAFLWLLALAAGSVSAQSGQALLDAYVRVVSIANDGPAYLGELLQGCVSAGILSATVVEGRHAAYMERNTPMIRRVAAWMKKTESRLSSAGLDRAVSERSYEAGTTAVTASSKRARDELISGGNIGALCRSRLEALDTGAYDLERNAELLAIIGKEG